jgi:uracil-DNA glycosylase family 4
MPNKNKILSVFNEKVLSCTRCDPSANKNIGFGNIESSIMFVAQNPRVIPYPDSERLIYPFDLNNTPTRSGQNLLKFIEALRIEDYYLTNIMKCSTPKNRAPNKEEMKQCAPFLKFEIQLQRPKVIFFFGKPASLFYELYGCDILEEAKLDPKIYRAFHPSYFHYNRGAFDKWIEFAKDISYDLPELLRRG